MKNTLPLVTKDSLRKLLKEKRIEVLGRALVAIYNRQTTEEQKSERTRFVNGRGFDTVDGKIGTICAKHYLKYGTLDLWQHRYWYERILKYTNQLNDVAIEKRLRN
jgi:hypothetical protein